MMTATTATDAWLAFAYTIAGTVWLMRKGWAMSDPKMREQAWWVQ